MPPRPPPPSFLRPPAPAASSVTRAARQLHETVSSLLSGCWGPPGTRVDPARQTVSAQPADRWTCPGVGRGGARMGLGPRRGEAVWLRRVGRLPEPRLLPVRSEGSRAEPVRGPRPRGQRPGRCGRRAAQRACDLSAGAAGAPCPLGSRPLPSGGCTCLICGRGSAVFPVVVVPGAGGLVPTPSSVPSSCECRGISVTSTVLEPSLAPEPLTR